MALPRKGHIVPKKHRKGSIFDHWSAPKRRKIELTQQRKIKESGISSDSGAD